VSAPFDVRFVFSGDAAAIDYSLTGYTNPITITSDGTLTFTMSISDDAINENTETLTLSLLLIDTASITGANSQSITFIDNDGAGVDVNGDGIVSPTDAIYVLNRLGTTDTFADVNGDNVVDSADYDAVIAELGTSAP
jgi:hypothetical protein